jgi:hypothetical protein
MSGRNAALSNATARVGGHKVLDTGLRGYAEENDVLHPDE